jgi:polyisoprenoid-binding protein YceI
MLKKMIVGGVLGVVALFAVAAGGWWLFVREDARLATEPPEIPASLVQAAATPTGAAATNDPASAVPDATASSTSEAFEVVSESSEAAYFADEQLASIGVPSTAKGATNDVTGTFYLTADGWALDQSRTSTFTVDLTTLSSDESRRDSRVHEALETSTYPTATFTVTGISGVDSTLSVEEQQTFQMTGILDLHGVQREITWEVEARREGNVITALATTNFLYEDFGIPVLNIGGFVSVEDDVTLQMQIIAQAV